MAINKKSIRLNQVPLNAHVGRNIMLASLMLILLGIHLQYTQEYLFYFRETLMVFYYDASIIASRYFGIGGPGLLLTHWITQFFILKYVGAIVTAVLGTLSALMIWSSLPKHKKAVILLPLCIVPFIFQCHALFDIYYDYQGAIAFFLFSLFAYLYRLLANRTPKLVILWASLLSLCLFYIASSAGFLLAIYLFITELTDKPLRSWRLLFPIALLLIISGYCIAWGIVPRWRDAISNEAYYEPILQATNFFHTSWIVVILLPLLAPALSGMEAKMKEVIVTICTLVVLFCVSAFATYSGERNQQKMYPMITMDHYINKHDWEGLLKLPYCQSSNFILMNRVNLALSHSGRFLDDFFHYPQIAPYSILTELNELALDVEINTTLSEVFWQMDNIASADEKAFNTYEGLRYGSPTNLQMLVRTSLVFGRYQHAEKYIKLLEKTLFYKDWASSQRRFLYNDKAVEADPEYGSKRKSLPQGTREFIQARGPYYDLLLTLRTNPKAHAARDYAIGYLLLANDIPHINAFIEEFYGTEAMPVMPIRLQEAAVAANEKNLGWCRQHGVQEDVIEEYQKLRQVLLQLNQNNSKSTTALMPWRYTYWYYLLVTSPNMAKMREALQNRKQAAEAEQMSAH